jgi:hypothetical protein
MIPVEAGNKAIQDGSIAQTLQELGSRLKPEASYFCSIDGKRAAYIVFDMQDTKSIPAISEPLFSRLNAAVDFVPVMNLDDLRAGLSQVPR